MLGIGEDYKRLLAGFSDRAVGDFLEGFQNNLDLLIQKTWVEKSEESRKERLLDSIPEFIATIKSGDYAEALEEFGDILEELAYLFFGAQSQKDDFAEYVLRIDEQMGLFWWYCGQIKAAQDTAWLKSSNPDVQHAMLFLGICYLTNF